MFITLCIIAALVAGEVTGARVALARMLERARSRYEDRP